MGFVLDYAGPLTKTDARKVLGKLIGESNAAPLAFSTRTTFGELAREYIELNKPNWGENERRVSENLIKIHLIGKLGDAPGSGANGRRASAVHQRLRGTRFQRLVALEADDDTCARF